MILNGLRRFRTYLVNAEITPPVLGLMSRLTGLPAEFVAEACSVSPDAEGFRALMLEYPCFCRRLMIWSSGNAPTRPAAPPAPPPPQHTLALIEQSLRRLNSIAERERDQGYRE